MLELLMLGIIAMPNVSDDQYFIHKYDCIFMHCWNSYKFV